MEGFVGYPDSDPWWLPILIDHPGKFWKAQELDTSQMSNGKKTGCLGYIGNYTTFLCGDYRKPL